MRQKKDAAVTPQERKGGATHAKRVPGKVDGVKGSGYSKGQAKREEILIGLIAALNRGELRNPSLKAIGQALGVEPAHILYYFKSREELLQAVIVRWDRDALGQLPDGSPKIMDIDEYEAIIARNVVRPGVVHLYLAFAAEAVEPSHPAHDFIRERFDKARTALAAAIRQEQDLGTISAAIDPAIEARLLIALADGLQLQSLIDPDIDAAAHLKSAIVQLRESKFGECVNRPRFPGV